MKKKQTNLLKINKKKLIAPIQGTINNNIQFLVELEHTS